MLQRWVKIINNIFNNPANVKYFNLLLISSSLLRCPHVLVGSYGPASAYRVISLRVCTAGYTKDAGRHVLLLLLHPSYLAEEEARIALNVIDRSLRHGARSPCRRWQPANTANWWRSILLIDSVRACRRATWTSPIGISRRTWPVFDADQVNVNYSSEHRLATRNNCNNVFDIQATSNYVKIFGEHVSSP